MIIIESVEHGKVIYKYNGILYFLHLNLEMIEDATKITHDKLEHARISEIKTSVFMFHISNGKRV